MKSNTALVTAFFDINRSKFKTSKLDNSKYFEYFKFVAHLQNDLFVFTDTDEHKKIIENIRNKYCPNFITKVYIEKLDKIDEDLYKKILNTFNEFDQSTIRKDPDRIECLYPKYCFINIVKFIFVSKIINDHNQYNYYGWIDFGFNHGTEYYSTPLALTASVENLKKRINAESDKLILFKTPEKNTNNRSIAELYITLNTPIMGGLQLGGKGEWSIHYKNMRTAINTFNSLGIVHDDQLYLLYCYRNNKENYLLLPTNAWFDSLNYLLPINSKIQINTAIKKYKYYLSICGKYYKNKYFLKAIASLSKALLYYIFKRKAKCRQCKISRVDDNIDINKAML